MTTREGNNETEDYKFPNQNEKFEMGNGRVIAIGNVGSLGVEDNLTEGNSTVRRNVISFLARLHNRYGRVDGLFLQETNNSEAKFPPIIDYQPTQTDYHVTFGRGDRGVRGVANWLKREDNFKEHDERTLASLPIDRKNEIVTSIIRYNNAKRKSVPVALINVYRNTHSNFKRSVEETKAALKILCSRLRCADVQNFIIFGDFNTENIQLEGCKRIRHPQLFHKANLNSKKTQIDCVFTNMLNAGFLDVNPSFENVHNNELNNKNWVLGHKAYSLWIGHKPTRSGKTTMKIATPVRLRREAKEWNQINSSLQLPNIRILENNQRDDYCNETQINNIAMSMIKIMKDIKLRATKTVKVAKVDRQDQIIFENIEKSNDFKRNVTKPWKSLYNFTSAVKEDYKIESGETETEKPTLSKLTEVLQEKFDNLRSHEPALVEDYIQKQFPPNYSKKGTFTTSRSEFRRLIMDTSNSSALDAYNISLKDAKAILGGNTQLRNSFQGLIQRCFITGIFPEPWKKDLIFFIWKRKGQKSDPSKYRPISISCTLGKMMEKIMGKYISNRRENNPKNHAYVTSKSCQTAITQVQKDLLKIQLEQDRNLGAAQYIHLPALSADDIEGAFQEVNHDVICKALKNDYMGDDFYDISSLVNSYLKRDTNTIDRRTGETIEIRKKFRKKSIPQGTILSPGLWRLFDGLFSGYYDKLLDELAAQENNSLVKATDNKFADDHMTLNHLRVRKREAQNNALMGLIIKTSIKATRSLLVVATEKFGCSCNPDKSENVVQPKYVEFCHSEEFKTKDHMKWLGYKIRFLDDGRLIFDIEYAKSKLTAASILGNGIYQYTKKVKTRVIFYKTYMGPFTEWFLPIVLQESEIADTPVHSFQRSCLKEALDLPFTASTIETERILNERPVKLKAKRMAMRIDKTCNTLKWEEEIIKQYHDKRNTEPSNIASTTRASKEKKQRSRGVSTGTKSFRNNFIFRMNAFLSIDDEGYEKSQLDYQQLTKELKMLRVKIEKRIKRRKLHE